MAASSPTAGSPFGDAADSVWQAMESLRTRFEKRDGAPAGHGAGPHDVRRAVLALLAEEPMHGYRVIHEIEERTAGAWTPEAGAVYPTLQLLADEGLIAAETTDGRKVYALTEAGRAAVARDGITAPWAHAADAHGHDGHDRHDRSALPKAGLSLAQAAAQVQRTGTPAQVAEAVAELDAARRRLYAILARE
ncbi:DNA-binding PadR family transcriptional regulator [Clavibacter michiganensis]|uniref:PadR family transcriptional regulator n=1 Tax=Clavibacter michiganensis TaxID=28447 RepID=UPI001AE7DDD7|nr:PadR family transcriptional regulator [Clavibacter michiganensis]MBP2457895.1 DNA-binding PadR family transcriptional regulator [Clavibacter michiganensis]MDQ0410465.1 DNA-binding PadR family transcriptional regulator [Clavibacter michiganensis]